MILAPVGAVKNIRNAAVVNLINDQYYLIGS